MSIEHHVVGVALVKILHMLYEHDILSEEVILHWHKDVTGTDDVPERNKVRRQVRKYSSYFVFNNISDILNGFQPHTLTTKGIILRMITVTDCKYLYVLTIM